MVIAVLVGIFDGMPDGQCVRMQHDIRLTSEGRIPQERIALTIDTGRTANDMLLVFGNEKPAGIGLCCFDEELVVGNIPLGLEPMVLMKQLAEGFEIILALHLASDHPTRHGIVDALLHLLRDTLFWQTAVEGVVDAHPMHREKALLAELLVAERLMGQVTEFDIERLAAHLLGDGLEHLFEKVFLAPLALGVLAFTHHATMHEEIGWEDGGAVTYYGEKLTQYMP